MEQRRRCRRETQQYKQLDKIIRSKCSEAKTNFYNAQCVQLEKLERSNSQLIHVHSLFNIIQSTIFQSIHFILWRHKNRRLNSGKICLAVVKKIDIYLLEHVYPLSHCMKTSQ